jgi:thiamine-monophosphate kinase
MIENVHFTRDSCPPEWLAYKLLARNASDIAAMGARPKTYLVSLAVPASISDDFLPRFYRGLKRAQKFFGAQMVGGDFSSSPSGILFSSVAMLGQLQGRPLLRAGARPKDSIWVSGALGKSATALELLQAGKVSVNISTKNFRFHRIASQVARGGIRQILHAHFLPQPRMKFARWLAENKIATSAIDLSDGLSTDLHRLCAASKVGAVVHVKDLPIARAVLRWSADPLARALHGGEDYELLFTVRRSAEAKLAKVSRDTALPRRIGEIVERQRGVSIETEGMMRRLDPGGFDHLGNR